MKSFVYYLVGLIFGLAFVGSVASRACATDYVQQQRVIVKQQVQQVYVPQQVIVQEKIIQRNVDPYLSQFSSTNSFRIRQEQLQRSNFRQQQFFSSSSSRQRNRGGGNFSSFEFRSSSNRGGGFLRNLFPF
jgi:Tfp pilus assembly protein PilP